MGELGTLFAAACLGAEFRRGFVGWWMAIAFPLFEFSCAAQKKLVDTLCRALDGVEWNITAAVNKIWEVASDNLFTSSD